MEHEQALKAQPIVKSIHPLLAGQPPEIQSAVIADLLATFLAGHFAATEERTAAARENILEVVLGLVRELIPVNEVAILRKGNGH